MCACVYVQLVMCVCASGYVCMCKWLSCSEYRAEKVCACGRAYVHVCMHMCVRACGRVGMCMRLYICVRVRVCLCVCVCYFHVKICMHLCACRFTQKRQGWNKSGSSMTAPPRPTVNFYVFVCVCV